MLPIHFFNVIASLSVALHSSVHPSLKNTTRPERLSRSGHFHSAGGVEGLGDIGEDVVDMFDADGQADIAAGDAGFDLIFGG